MFEDEPALEPGEYSSYYLDSLAAYDEHDSAAAVMSVPSVAMVANALERHLLAIMSAHGHQTVRLSTAIVIGQLAPPPQGWLVLRSTAVVQEFDVVVDGAHAHDPEDGYELDVDG